MLKLNRLSMVAATSVLLLPMTAPVMAQQEFPTVTVTTTRTSGCSGVCLSNFFDQLRRWMNDFVEPAEDSLAPDGPEAEEVEPVISTWTIVHGCRITDQERTAHVAGTIADHFRAYHVWPANGTTIRVDLVITLANDLSTTDCLHPQDRLSQFQQFRGVVVTNAD